MESDDDTFIFPPLEEPAHPPKKLTRLRRLSSPRAEPTSSISPPPKTLRVDDLLKTGGESEGGVPVTVTFSSPGSEGLDAVGMVAEGGEMPVEVASPSLRSDALDDGGLSSADGFDPLFDAPGQFAGGDSSNLVWGADEEGENADIRRKGKEGDWSRELADASPKKKSAKKRLNLDSDDGDHEENKSSQKKKKKKVRPDKPENNNDLPATNERTLEKERKAQLEQLHAESQRLLRETRNASFKPVSVVQRPISSVLEKIRLRKLEVSRKFGGVASVSHADGLQQESADVLIKTNGAPSGTDSSKTLEDCNSGKGNPATVDTTYAEGIKLQDMPGPMFKNSSPAEDADPLNEDARISMDLPEGEGKQEKTGIRHQSSSEICVPSLLATDSNSDSDIPDDTSSDEEDDDKENTDPLEQKSTRLNLFKGDLAKSFMDDEAEEEDDSDNDLMRFPENEEDDEGEEHEELNDLIATAFEENHVDHEKRNQLHQKWLEEKDAEETENYLQRFKHYKERDCTIHDEEHTEECQEENEKDDLDNDPVQETSVKDITRKAKQKIASMFTEKDEDFVSSDEEETEQRLSRQRLLEQTEGHVSLLPPQEEDDSSQVFSLIKKLNIVPDPQKRIKPARSSFDVSLLGSNGNSSSKSFLGRAIANSMPAPCKPSSSCFKSFVFGRDDSNSRCGISSSDSVLEINRIESQSSGTIKAKANPKYSTFKTNTPDEKTSGPSLFEILRRSSVQFDQQLKNAKQVSNSSFSATQTTYQLQAFRLNKTVKKLPQKS